MSQRTTQKTDSIAVPWSTSFETDFCDHRRAAGFCYSDPAATYETVITQAHSGVRSAAFQIKSDDPEANQARCVRQGVLPTAAYYGVWYYVPALATNTGLWNLVHFQGGDTTDQHGLWDISLVNTDTGDLRVVVFDFLNGAVRQAEKPVPIPIGRWFHLEMYLKRAADKTGEVALYQDGAQAFDVKDIVTDDSNWGQWYVGNLADALSPSESTLYIDDLTITATR